MENFFSPIDFSHYYYQDKSAYVLFNKKGLQKYDTLLSDYIEHLTITYLEDE
jgi:hypothetical protein